MLTSTIYDRCRILLMNRTNSEQYRKHLARWHMALTISILVTTEHRIDNYKSFRDKVRSLYEMGMRNLLSDEHLCILSRMVTYASQINRKNAHKITDKSLKKWAAPECADPAKRDQLLGEFRRDYLGEKTKHFLSMAIPHSRQQFQLILQHPGATTRMIRLLGSKKRFNELCKQCSLVMDHLENVFTDSYRRWNNYAFGIQNTKLAADDVENFLPSSAASRLAADITAVMRWLDSKLVAQNRMELWEKVKKYVAEEIYDPLFDKEEEQLRESAQFLERMFWETKKLGESQPNGAENGQKMFKKWKEMLENSSAGPRGKEQNESLAVWLRELHRKEFTSLLQNEKMDSFLEIIEIHDPANTHTGLLHFFDNNTLADIFRELNIENIFEGQKESELGKILFIDQEEWERELFKDENPEYSEGSKLLGHNVEQLINSINNQSSAEENMHLSCPPKELSLEQLREFDKINRKEKLSHFVQRAFLDYISYEGPIGPSLRKTQIAQMELHSAIWWLFSMCQDLLEKAEQILETNSEGMEPKFGMAIRRLKSEWTEVVAEVEEEFDPADIKMFLERFLAKIQQDKDLLESSPEWILVLQNEHLLILDEQSQTLKMTTIDHFEHAGINYYCVVNLIEQFFEFQRYFCNLSANSEMQKAKGRLELLIGGEHLITLDDLFPEILQIDVVTPSNQVALYKQFLQQQAGTMEAYLAEARLAIPILLQHTRKDITSNVVEIKDQTNGKVLVRAIMNRDMAGALNDKFELIKKEVYTALGQQDMKLLRALCIAQSFEKFCEDTLILYATKEELVSAGAIRDWQIGNGCDQEQEQHKAFQHQRKKLIPTYDNDLAGIILRVDMWRMKEFMKTTRGARTRLKKLLGMKRYDKMMEDYSTTIRDEQAFDDSHLANDYLLALFGEDEGAKVVGKLSVSIAVLIRWMDSELAIDNPNRTIGLKQLDQLVWKRRRLYFEDLYDELIDDSFDQLERKSYLIRDLFQRIREFVETKRDERKLAKLHVRRMVHKAKRQKGAQEIAEIGIRRRDGKVEKCEDSNAMMQEWDRMVEGEEAKKASEEQEQEVHTEEEEEADEFDRWMQRLHWSALLGLLEGAEFREIIKKIPEWEKEVKDGLRDFIGLEMVNEIVAFLNLKSDSELNTKKQLKMMEEKLNGEEEGKGEKERAEKDKEADRHMEELIREEERIKELKKKIEQIQREKQRKRVEEQRRKKGEGGKEERAKNKEEVEEEEKEQLEESEEEEKGEFGTKDNETENDTSDEEIIAENQGGKEIKESGQEIVTVDIFDDDVQAEFSKGKLISFVTDQFLYDEYCEFLKNPSEAKRILLEFGACINEIGHRMEAIEQFDGLKNDMNMEIIGPGKVIELREKWEEMRRKLKEENSTVVSDAKKFEEMRGELVKMLKWTIFAIEGKEYGEEEEEREKNKERSTVEKEMKWLNGQLHRNNLARAIIWWEREEKKMSENEGNESRRSEEEINEKETNGKESSGEKEKASEKESASEGESPNDKEEEEEEKKGGNGEEDEEAKNNGENEQETTIKSTEKDVIKSGINENGGGTNKESKGEIGRKAKNIWAKMDEKEQSRILSILFNRKEAKSNMVSRFHEHLENWRALMGQKLNDIKLYESLKEQNLAINKLENPFLRHENMQQIYFQGHEEHRQEQLLNGLLLELDNGYTENKMADRSLRDVKGTISKWSNNEARLIVTGSYLLGVHTSNSDIDTICVIPQKLSEMEENSKFYGDPYSRCDLALDGQERSCEDNSLYCRLCKQRQTESLQKLPRAYVPLIELKSAGIDFDISFVAIGTEYLPDEPMESRDVGWMMEMLAAQREPPEAMLKSLSSYLANKYILELLKGRNLAKFRMLVLLMKFWTKGNYVYGNIFGFFNGVSLSVLAAKIILLYPNSTVPFLLEKLFLTFSTWKWPFPVQLNESAGGVFERFSWKPSMEPQQMIMPIITPSVLAQNAAFNINKSTFKIIKDEMQKAFSHMRKLRNSSESLNKELWKTLFPPQNHFTEKYQHFVIISCVVSALQHIDQFCGFVARRMRLQLLHFDTIMGDTVEYSHVNPTKEFINKNNQCPIPISNYTANFRNPLCKLWLIGLKMKKLNKELPEKLNKKLHEEFDAIISKDYAIMVLRGRYQHVVLESRYVGQSELAEWNDQNHEYS